MEEGTYSAMHSLHDNHIFHTRLDGRGRGGNLSSDPAGDRPDTVLTELPRLACS
jgi:hypothetical protein